MADPALVSVNVAIDTFSSFVAKTNAAITDLQTIVVTVNSTAGLTTGSGYVNGSFSALQLLTPSLAGGNLSGLAVLVVSTNASIGNSTVNTQIGFAQINLGGVSINSGTLGIGANVSLNTSAFSLGNSTVNLATNSSLLSIPSVNLQTLLNVGSNVSLSTANLVIGNTTINSVINSSSVATGLLTIGSNVTLNASALDIGNSVANLAVNSILLQIQNSTALANLGPASLVLGGMTVNTSTVAVGTTTVNSSGFFGGAADILSLGNSTINLVINSSGLKVDGSPINFGGGNVVVAVSSVLVGNASTLNFVPGSGVGITGTVDGTDGYVNVVFTASPVLGGANTDVLFNDSGTSNGIANLTFNKTTGTLFLANTFDVGTNVSVNTSAIDIGNTTVSFFANSVLGQYANSTATANLSVNGLAVGTVGISPGGVTGGSGASVSLGNTTANAFVNSIIFEPANASGQTVITPLSAGFGNTTANLTANSISLQLINATAQTFITPVSAFFGNTTANAFVNSVLLELANSTAISNLQPGLLSIGVVSVNTTALGVGANVVVSTSAFSVGNSTVNAVGNSTQLDYSNSTVSSILAIGSLALGNATVNVAINSSSMYVLGVINPVFDVVHNLYGGL